MPFSSSDPAEPASGLRRDMHRAREGAFATTAELREFVHNLRGKSPQEVLGAVANSGLAQGVVLATLGTIALIAVFTVIPYSLYGGKAAAKAALEAKKVAAAKESAESTAEASADTAASKTDKAAPASKTAEGNAQQTLEKMGESETKQADPKTNPLDNLDDLLDTKK
ncbi:MAG: hypothetical protein JWN70_710 [Planctomycetaceae bacterium]|nr:hypothetical protein [Planctomycetaceae bacterium]